MAFIITPAMQLIELDGIEALPWAIAQPLPHLPEGLDAQDRGALLSTLDAGTMAALWVEEVARLQADDELRLALRHRNAVRAERQRQAQAALHPTSPALQATPPTPPLQPHPALRAEHALTVRSAYQPSGPRRAPWSGWIRIA